ncbi:uncharacterized protein LOC143191161 [Rhynchophorus ferrugineus]|uniref:uncharacterized protein LOC143191161 n=1 Tax=Rhynchophorus ferrugineus TaxID=354439 RepID=UPI003FCD6F2F
MASEDLPVKMDGIVELELGKLLVKQLEDKFGDPTLTYPEGFQTKIQVPKSFAMQLHSFFIQSVFDQMEATFGSDTLDSLKAEDKEFSESLFGDEVDTSVAQEVHESLTSSNTITKREVRKKKKKQAAEYKDITLEDLAIEMMLDKLSDIFPLAEKESIMQMLQVYNYEEAVNSLLLVQFPTNPNIADVKKPPLDEVLFKEIQGDFMKYKNELGSKQVCGEDYRKEAENYLQNRQNLYEKANYFKQKDQIKVAQFYSNLAAKQTLYYEQASARAVSAFLDANCKQSKNTLNLHFLRPAEATTAVDIFLDGNINSLRESDNKTKSQLQIVTGRGKHSPEGKAVLRPAVQSLLKARGLRFNLLNEGMISVKIRVNSKLSNELTELS